MNDDVRPPGAEETRSLTGWFRVAAAVAFVAMVGLFGACFYDFTDPAGPIEFATDDLGALPAGYEIVAFEQSCGQGNRPFDCGAVVVVAGRQGDSDQEVVDVVSERLCRGAWECTTDEGSLVAARQSFFGREDDVVVVPAGAIPAWAEDAVSVTALRQDGRPWVVLEYTSVRR